VNLPVHSTLDDLLLRAKEWVPNWKAITFQVPHNASDPMDFAIDTSGYGAVGQSSALELDRTGNVVAFTPADTAHTE
jgi:hypothetical protein